MATPTWKVSGQYYETCSCDFVCPCLPAGIMARPSKGSCTFAMAFSVERGILWHGLPGRTRVHHVGLHARRDGQGKLVGRPHRRRAGDRRAARRHCRDRQRRRRRSNGCAFGTGRNIPGRRVRTDSLRSSGNELVRQGVELRGHGGGRRARLEPNSSEPMHFDHTGHPAADRFALARASSSRVQALGLAWEDLSGKNNGQYAPFSWGNA